MVLTWDFQNICEKNVMMFSRTCVRRMSWCIPEHVWEECHNVFLNMCEKNVMMYSWTCVRRMSWCIPEHVWEECHNVFLNMCEKNVMMYSWTCVRRMSWCIPEHLWEHHFWNMFWGVDDHLTYTVSTVTPVKVWILLGWGQLCLRDGWSGDGQSSNRPEKGRTPITYMAIQRW